MIVNGNCGAPLTRLSVGNAVAHFWVCSWHCLVAWLVGGSAGSPAGAPMCWLTGPSHLRSKPFQAARARCRRSVPANCCHCLEWASGEEPVAQHIGVPAVLSTLPRTCGYSIATFSPRYTFDNQSEESDRAAFWDATNLKPETGNCIVH